MTLLVLVIMPLTEMSLLMSDGFKSLMTFVSTKSCGFVCNAKEGEGVWTKRIYLLTQLDNVATCHSRAQQGLQTHCITLSNTLALPPPPSGKTGSR